MWKLNEQNKQKGNRLTAAQNRLTAVRGEGFWGLGEQGEGIKQRRFVVAEEPQRRDYSIQDIVSNVEIWSMGPGGCLRQQQDHSVEFMVSSHFDVHQNLVRNGIECKLWLRKKDVFVYLKTVTSFFYDCKRNPLSSQDVYKVEDHLVC